MTTANSPELEYRVTGMDCANCAKKIENLLEKTPGASQAKVNFTTETLRLILNEQLTSRHQLEANLKALGYPLTLKVAVVEPDDHDAVGHLHAPEENVSWYATRASKLVFLTGGLLLIAWLFGSLEPQLAVYGYIVATVVGAIPLARRALAATRFGNPFTIEALVSVAAIGAIAINEAPEAAVVVFFFMIGEWLEGISAGRARAGIKALAALTPKTALLIHSGGEGTHAAEHTDEISAERLKVGQLVLVQPGSRVPCDGIIETGFSSLDDSPVTGESMPVSKQVGDLVFAGSINGDAALKVRVTKAASDNTIARIIKLVEEAQDGKGNTARFIDRFSRWWTPAVFLAASLVAILPPLFGLGAWHDWIYRGVSLLLIGCPCALVLSVPAAITSGLSSGARRGLLIKGGAALENVGTVTTIAFDKTGTLTAGKPVVTDVFAFGLEKPELLRFAAGVEQSSSHPLAKAILEYAKAQSIVIPSSSEARAIQGKAAIATVENRVFAVGSPKYAAELAPLENSVQTQIAALENTGKTVVVILEGNVALGMIGIRDEPRTDAKQAIAELKAQGISSIMLTGDNARTGKAIADGLGVEVKAELMPEEKLELITQYAANGKVAFVGDGINDAPALAKADVGIAMGGGTDVALETADAAILRSNLTGVVELVQLSRAVMGNIRQNITFALGLKAVFLVTTLLGYTNLWMAILADTGATALVTANALRLLAFKPTRSEG
jgi:Zn2+/Cd2+-exporting ATPase